MTKLAIPKRGWTIIHLGLLAVTAWIMAGIFSTVLAGIVAPATSPKTVTTARPAPKSIPRADEDFSQIVKRNIFNSAQKAEDVEPASVDSTGTDGAPAPKSELAARLVGTVTDPGGGFRAAMIELKEKQEQKLYRVGDFVLGAKIISIQRNRVLLTHDGRTEALWADYAQYGKEIGGSSSRLSMTQDVAKLSDSEYNVSKRYLDSQLQEMNRLLTEVRAVPNTTKDGATDGFKLFSIKKGSIFDKIGFKDHDIVKRVNGMELNSAEKGLELFQALRNEKNFDVDITRNTQKTSLRFTVQ